MFYACDRSVVMATVTGAECGGKKGRISNAKTTKWRLRFPRKVARRTLRSRLSFYCFRKLNVRRANETEDGVRDPVIDITHFCSNGIGAARCKKHLHALLVATLEFFILTFFNLTVLELFNYNMFNSLNV